MPLFDNRQAVNLRACEQMVESVLATLGIDAAESRVSLSDEPALSLAWGLTSGSARLYIYLTSSSTSDDNYIHVVAPVFRPPDDASNELWRNLLELNVNALTGAAFGLRDGEIVLTTDRSTLDLERTEIEDMIRRIGAYANHYDDLLAGTFSNKI